jgi:hypothetical protein
LREIPGDDVEHAKVIGGVEDHHPDNCNPPE